MKTYLSILTIGFLLITFFSCGSFKNELQNITKNGLVKTEPIQAFYAYESQTISNVDPPVSIMEVYTWNLTPPSFETIFFSGRGLDFVDSIFIGDSRGLLLNLEGDSILYIAFNDLFSLEENAPIIIHADKNQQRVIELAERYTTGKRFIPRVDTIYVKDENFVFNNTKGVLFECSIGRLAPRAATTTAYLGNQAISPYQLNANSDTLRAFLSNDQLLTAIRDNQPPLFVDFGYGLKSLVPNSQEVIYSTQ